MSCKCKDPIPLSLDAIIKMLRGPDAVRLVKEWENDEDYPSDIESAVRREAKRLLLLEKLIARKDELQVEYR